MTTARDPKQNCKCNIYSESFWFSLHHYHHHLRTTYAYPYVTVFFLALGSIFHYRGRYTLFSLAGRNFLYISISYRKYVFTHHLVNPQVLLYSIIFKIKFSYLISDLSQHFENVPFHHILVSIFSFNEKEWEKCR